jgi:hypothetical protein
MRHLMLLALAFTLLSQQPVMAGPAADTLGRCLADNTSGKDRKELARWIYLALSAHPEIRGMSAATDDNRLASDKGMAALVTRLLADTCAAETRAVVQAEGNTGMFNAFKSLGELAMQELMSNPDVAAAVGGYARHLDSQRINAALTAR